MSGMSGKFTKSGNFYASGLMKPSDHTFNSGFVFSSADDRRTDVYKAEYGSSTSSNMSSSGCSSSGCVDEESISTAQALVSTSTVYFPLLTDSIGFDLNYVLS